MEFGDIEKVLREGFPLPSEARREELLNRCLAEIDCYDGREIDDDALDALAAAGDIFVDAQNEGQRPDLFF